jgi:hypothetical protein
MRTKKTRRELEAVRARATTPLEWVPTPAWFIGGEVDILLPVEDVDLTSITKAVYVAALEAAVDDRELSRDHLEPEQQEASWRRFVAWREGDHGPHIDAAKQPVAPQQPVHATEHYGHEAGATNRRSTLETRAQMDDRHDEERQRLLAIANAAPVRYFT